MTELLFPLSDHRAMICKNALNKQPHFLYRLSLATIYYTYATIY